MMQYYWIDKNSTAQNIDELFLVISINDMLTVFSIDLKKFVYCQLTFDISTGNIDNYTQQ